MTRIVGAIQRVRHVFMHGNAFNEIDSLREPMPLSGSGDIGFVGVARWPMFDSATGTATARTGANTPATAIH
ncbi:hypothetical protein B0G69_5213 [Paraburkholderia sp. RAU2J]|uniref:hypothetical protein n=1 Tax=Paraburkholderia sp. RAU2J TaxID=1938810 RepID=UPI000F1972D9|nr:hypothetical protein [Paraburkholderia sp. RAU2J]RKT21802.1 hypothetical protein B0G69_5213 [Paraburkholderia sp. RAU2J]